MVLGFKPDFVPLIIAGTKVHTIRAGNRWADGQAISFCTNVAPDALTRFQPDGVVKVVQTIQAKIIHGTYLIEIDGRQLQGNELAEFVRRDGFSSLAELFDFLVSYHGLPFTGQLIHWTELVY
jgi:hypothetical protein